MSIQAISGLWLSLGLALLYAPQQPAEKLPPPEVEKPAVRSRTFEFSYTATVVDLPASKKVRIWVPVATSGPAQDVRVLSSEVKSGEPDVRGKFTTGKQYGNRFFFVETTPRDGKVSLKLVYRVTRREVQGATRGKEDAAELARFLRPDALVPITGKPLRLLNGKELPEDPMRKARLFYDTVNAHLKYSKEGTGWGRGDSVWACDSRTGNCSDFHSLFISLARAHRVPARFEIGFPLPAARGRGTIPGYHCWAYFHIAGKGWLPVDISEANKDPRRKDYYFTNLSEDRVAFSIGRDLELSPPQAGKPVNFLVYPYLEVDGKEFPSSKVEKTFTYRDVK
jgi:transglutaminase-like putative cysteine protease